MRTFKKPDLNAPRFRPKVFNVLNKDLWKAFKEKYPKYSKISYTTFKEIISRSNEIIRESVINNRDGVELPESLGFLFIGTCKIKSYKSDNINYGKSIKSGVSVTNNNWESDGMLCKIFYTNYAVKYKVRDRQIWTFRPCRLFKRSVAKAYPENWTKYIIIENQVKISKMYSALSYIHYKEKVSKENLKTYNEFDIE